MGYSINVNHSRFEATAEAIEAYNTDIKNKMTYSGYKINEMLNHWEGSDADSFEQRWNELYSNNSTSNAMKQALDNHASYLRFAATKYKTAQIDAVNRANRLSVW